MHPDRFDKRCPVIQSHCYSTDRIAYERVIGQLLRYMGWIEQNLSEGQPVRGMIVASEITEDLVLATNHIADRVKLFEYAISFSIKQKDRD